MLAEKAIRSGDRVGSNFIITNRVNFVSGKHALCYFARAISMLDHSSGEESEQFSFFVHDRKGSELEMLLVNQFDDVPDLLVCGNGDRILNKSVNMMLGPRDFLDLLAVAHIVMYQADPSAKSQCNGHFRLGYRVHVR